jgi:hypothetical protein
MKNHNAAISILQLNSSNNNHFVELYKKMPKCTLD